MLDFLKKCEISDEVIKDMSKVNSSANIYNFSCNQDEVVKIIEFLKKIGITCINQLLIHRIELFFDSLVDFKKIFDKEDVDSFVRSINDDYTCIN